MTIGGKREKEEKSQRRCLRIIRGTLTAILYACATRHLFSSLFFPPSLLSRQKVETDDCHSTTENLFIGDLQKNY